MGHMGPVGGSFWEATLGLLLPSLVTLLAEQVYRTCEAGIRLNRRRRHHYHRHFKHFKLQAAQKYASVWRLQLHRPEDMPVVHRQWHYDQGMDLSVKKIIGTDVVCDERSVSSSSVAVTSMSSLEAVVKNEAALTGVTAKKQTLSFSVDRLLKSVSQDSGGSSKTGDVTGKILINTNTKYMFFKLRFFS